MIRIHFDLDQNYRNDIICTSFYICLYTQLLQFGIDMYLRKCIEKYYKLIGYAWYHTSNVKWTQLHLHELD